MTPIDPYAERRSEQNTVPLSLSTTDAVWAETTLVNASALNIVILV